MKEKIKISKRDFTKLTILMADTGFCVIQGMPMCEGDCDKCLETELLKLVELEETNSKDQIEIYRKRLEAKVQLFGLSDERTIKESQNLNNILNQYNKNKDLKLNKLNKLNLKNFVLADEGIKLSEEHNEFQMAAFRNDKGNAIEEFWDCIQALVGVMDKLNISDKEIKQGLTRHNKKLLNRGWKFESSCSWY